MSIKVGFTLIQRLKAYAAVLISDSSGNICFKTFPLVILNRSVFFGSPVSGDSKVSFAKLIFDVILTVRVLSGSFAF